ncbi:armadillo-type protein [Thamnocephalis sphaerospora]|uniref:Exportin-T n=1 Tax=Thamnocephalis sphaerospora TaxID=78915 RepID=A0A4P9XJE3_9FUNG|nr:armadillo-type protein [Thamnocephalis sphaerospora]|eukprot:RKP05883.1 armadillo-type protein [Thamnocephalis sphaerospora]
MISPQATSYCEQLRASQDGWQLCLSLFARDPKSSQEARLFSLQVVEEVLASRFNELSQDQIQQLRQTLLGFLQREYVVNAGASIDNEPIFLRNKLAHTVVLLFVRTYLKDWNAFFNEMLMLAAEASASSDGGNMLQPRIVDFLLRVWMNIDEECVSMLVPRSKGDLDHNTLVKDQMREGDVQLLAQHWLQVLDSFHVREPQLAGMCLKVIGAYISE